MPELDVFTYSPEQIASAARNLGIKFPKDANDQEKFDMVRLAAIEKQKMLENIADSNVREKLSKKSGVDPMARKRDAPETIAIRASKKVVCLFENRESPPTDDGPGADVTFSVGAFDFHLHDHQLYVMPNVLVTPNPLEEQAVMDALVNFWMASWPKQKPMSRDQAEEAAINVLHSMNLSHARTRCRQVRRRMVEVSSNKQEIADNFKDGAIIEYPEVLPAGHRFEFRIMPQYDKIPANAAIGSLYKPKR